MDKWAHPKTDKNPSPHYLEHHLYEVADLAQSLASGFGGGDLAYVAGMGHDLGKATLNFQRRLRGLKHINPARHSRLGALLFSFSKMGTVGKWAAFLIDHHHGGFFDHEDYLQRVEDSRKAGRDFYHFPDSGSMEVCGKWVDETKIYLSTLNNSKLTSSLSGSIPNDGRCLAFFLRMVHSCLIEADRRDTKAHARGKSLPLSPYKNWNSISNRIESYARNLEKLSARSTIGTRSEELNRARSEIASEVMSKAKSDKGVFVLEIPTGGGKTLTGSRFAVEHMKHHNMSRFIYVAPFISIIEQSASNLKDFFGSDNVLEHHSRFKWENPSDLKGLERFKDAQANWESPVIVTTTVQLLESLFSSRCGPLQKIHNLVDSVIFIDEFQNIPLRLAAVTYQRIQELCKYYGCSVILASATSPVDQLERFGMLDKVNRILPNLSKYNKVFERTQTHVSFKPVTWKKIWKKIEQHNQVMVIATKKRGCYKLLKILKKKNLSKADHVYHLSSSMYPEHRTKMLKEVKNRLDKGEPVLLICTPTVEAGVDIDFPVVFKQRAPYDSIIQASGRCNREGRLQSGDFFVFSVEDRETDEYLGFPGSQWFMEYESTYHAFNNVGSADRLDYYYSLIFNQGDPRIFDNPDGPSILQMEKELKIKSSSEAYRIIEEESVSVPISGRGVDVQQVLNKPKLSEQDWEALQSVSVSSYPERLDKCSKLGYVRVVNDVPVWIGPYDDRWGTLPYEFEEI